MQANSDNGTGKRYHLNRPELAEAIVAALADCTDVKSQQRLLAMRLAASGQLTAAQIAEQAGVSQRQFFLGRSLEGAAQDSHAQRRSRQRRVLTDAVCTAQELERGWWQTGARLGSR